MPLHAPDFLVPEWPAPPGVHALCSTRSGGVSVSPYDSLNLGDHVGDAPDAVRTNRQRYAERLQARPVFLRQVHGWDVVRLDPSTPDGVEADVCVTERPGIACTMMVADCLPILAADVQGRVVGAAHAGWRGLAGQGGRGVVEVLFDAMVRALGGHPQDAGAGSGLVWWLGPCIGPSAFEVGPEVRAEFTGHDAGAEGCFRPLPGGKWLADLPALARRRLAAAGALQVHGNDGSRAWCTVTNASRFFSHRRDGVSGRFAASVWRDG